MSLSINIGRPFLNDKTLDEQARSILRLYGTDAHVYLPGANGVAVSGLPTNNYTISNGSTGYSAVDGTAGLVLDAAGSVGADEKTYSVGATWSQAGNTFTSITTDFGSYLGIGGSANKTYRVDVTVSGGALTQLANVTGAPLTLVQGANVVYVYATASPVRVQAAIGAVVTVNSVKEVTGIHATQSTTANKPALRRGLYNLLTYSNDLSNAAWVAEYTASKSGSNILTPAVGDDVYQGTTVAAGSYTLAAQLSGTGTCSLFAYNATDHIHGVTQITLTSTPTIFVGGITSTVANTFYYIGRRTGDTATSITFGGAGLFAGTLTAAQILAEGGIPLTTSAAASNQSAGRYSWQFDGTNDSLALGSPFQLNDDFLVVVGVCYIAPTSWSTVVSLSGATTTPRIQLYVDNTTGFVGAYFRDDASVNAKMNGVASIIGTSCVVTLLKVGTNCYLRVNGVQVATTSVAGLGATTLTGACVGKLFNGTDYMNGFVGEVILVKGTVSTSDALTLERQVASTFPAAPSF